LPLGRTRWLELRHVLGRDAGWHRWLTATQAGDPPRCVVGEPHSGGVQSVSPGAERGTQVMHLCFEVDDMDSAVRHLKERGVHLNADPVVLASGAGIHAGELTGTKILYLRDPDGIQLELFELPR